MQFGNPTLYLLLACVACSAPATGPEVKTPAAHEKSSLEREKVVRGDGASDGLELELVATKTVYELVQPLELRAYLKNVGESPLVVLRRASHGELGLDVVDDAGHHMVTLRPPAPPLLPGADDFASLAPQERLELRDWEILRSVNQQLSAGRGKSGPFSATARYHVSDSSTGAAKTAWVGAIKSNTLALERRPGEPTTDPPKGAPPVVK